MNTTPIHTDAPPATDTDSATHRLRREHSDIQAGFERLRSFVLADDAELMVGEWEELEAVLLRHMDAEEMFLLPPYALENVSEAAILRGEHAEIRTSLGEVGLALDLHTLRAPEIDALFRTVARHVSREERTLYPWAEIHLPGPALHAAVRRGFRGGRVATADAAVTLRRLFKVCKDAEQGYRQAALDTHGPTHRAVFERNAQRRAQFVMDLRGDLRALGAVVQVRGTVLGSAHRGWIGARKSVPIDVAGAILRECERGERFALRAYTVALQATLPLAAHEHVRSHRTEIIQALGELARLDATPR